MIAAEERSNGKDIVRIVFHGVAIENKGSRKLIVSGKEGVQFPIICVYFVSIRTHAPVILVFTMELA